MSILPKTLYFSILILMETLKSNKFKTWPTDKTVFRFGISFQKLRFYFIKPSNL